MPTIIVYPDGVGTYSAWDLSGAGDHLTAVIDDDDGTYITGNSGGVYDSFTIPDTTANGAIDNVRFYFRIGDGYIMNDGWMKPFFRIGSTNYLGTLRNPPYHSIDTYSQDWALSPATSATWTWAEISGMEIGVYGDSAWSPYYPNTHPMNVHKIWLAISYTETPIFSDCGGCGPCGNI